MYRSVIYYATCGTLRLITRSWGEFDREEGISGWSVAEILFSVAYTPTESV